MPLIFKTISLIKTTNSFFKIQAPPAPVPKPAPAPKTAKPKKSLFDKVILALKKQTTASGPQMQLPSMNMEEDDTPPLPPPGAPPPLPNEPPPPLPDDPKDNVTFDDLDDDLVLSIVSELDKNITEEEKLKKAKEKLVQILQKKASAKEAQQKYVTFSHFLRVYIFFYRKF